MAIKSSISNPSPVYGGAGVNVFKAAGTGKAGKGTSSTSSTPAKPYDITQDPYAALLYGASESAAQGQRATQQQNLNQQLLGITGQSGTLNQIMQTSADAQRRLADEMAYRGLLTSGVYAGEKTGVGTQMQKDYGQQIAAENQKVQSLTDPNALLEQGLRLNAQGAIEPIAPGDAVNWTDPTTGETKVVNFDWKQHTTAGRKAWNDALAQALAKYTANRSDVNA
jgi:hypothetical protein